MASSTTKIEDITTDEVNRKILYMLKANDAELVELRVCNEGHLRDDHEYCPQDARDLECVGYYVGKSTTLKELYLASDLFDGMNTNTAVLPFFKGVNSNRSIQKIAFRNMNLSGGEIFQVMRPFFDGNSNLSELEVDECAFRAGCSHQLSSALRVCKTSLKSLRIAFIQGVAGVGSEIIDALGTHPQLRKLTLVSINIGRNESGALAHLLRHSTTELHTLELSRNNLNGEEVDVLIQSLANRRLRTLRLSSNPTITVSGFQGLAAMLKRPSNLETLDLSYSLVGDKGACILSKALSCNNCKLKTLDLCNNCIKTEGYSAILKTLCDTSSVNSTYLSNHTLESLGSHSPRVPRDIYSSLALNRSSEDKKQVAIKKILKYHQHYDMQPFFEWDLKILPLAINWFERARSLDTNDEAGIDKHKLATIWQFIRAMPEIFEPVPEAGDKRKRSHVGRANYFTV